MITDQRRVLADLLDGLAAPDWDRPSLRSEWRVRDVATHVALTPRSPGVGNILVKAIRARGDFDGLNRDLAREYADRPPAVIVDDLRSLAQSRRKPAITTLDNLLFDVMVHVQDVAIPLGLRRPMPIQPARVGAERVWRMGWPFWAKRRLPGLRLVATDVEWSVGMGGGPGPGRSSAAPAHRAHRRRATVARGARRAAAARLPLRPGRSC